MIQKGPGKKLTVYVDETDRHGGKPVYEVLLDIINRHGISGASVFRGVAGYGSDGIFHTSKMLELSSTMPVKLEIVDSGEKISKVLPEIEQVVTKGLIEISDTTIIK
ncbi:MAG: DUF190 domain-containing protein [Nitrospirae bacterium]|nr:DUF190 domain-containing protein [Nitrospirota bacterium]